MSSQRDTFDVIEEHGEVQDTNEDSPLDPENKELSRSPSQSSENGDKIQDEGTNNSTTDDYNKSCRRLRFILNPVKPFIMPLFSIVVFCFDVGTDINAAVVYNSKGQTRYFVATLLCIVIPHICVILFDLQMVWADRQRWIGYYKDDKPSEQKEMVKDNQQAGSSSMEQSKSETTEEENNNANNNNTKNGSSSAESHNGNESGRCKLALRKTGTMVEHTNIYIFRMVLGSIGLGFIVRKLQQIYYKRQSENNPDEKWRKWFRSKKFEARRDSCHLGLISSFLEDCPQVLLQLYIFVQNSALIISPTGASIITSCLGLPWNFISYYKANRRQTKSKQKLQLRPDICKPATIELLVSLIGGVTARTLSIGLFMGTVNFYIAFLILAVHFIGNWLFIYFIQKPTFRGLSFNEDGKGKLVSVFFNILLYAMVNLFLFYDISGRDGKKWKIVVNNCVIYMENVAFVVLSLTLGSNDQTWIYCLIIGIASTTHITLLLMYYTLLHPVIGRVYGEKNVEIP